MLSIAEDKISWNLSTHVLMQVSDNTKSQFKICIVSYRPLKSALTNIYPPSLSAVAVFSGFSATISSFILFDVYLPFPSTV